MFYKSGDSVVNCQQKQVHLLTTQLVWMWEVWSSWQTTSRLKKEESNSSSKEATQKLIVVAFVDSNYVNQLYLEKQFRNKFTELNRTELKNIYLSTLPFAQSSLFSTSIKGGLAQWLHCLLVNRSMKDRSPIG